MNLFVRLFSLISSARAVRSKVSSTASTVKNVNKKLHTYEIAYIRGTIEKAENGNANAQYDLGDRFYDGLGVAQDYSEAAFWFGRAAENGHAQAQTNLGMMCALGRGVDRDDIEGFKWLSLAAASGDERAMKNLAKIEQRMTDDQVAEAKRRISRFSPKK